MSLLSIWSDSTRSCEVNGEVQELSRCRLRSTRSEIGRDASRNPLTENKEMALLGGVGLFDTPIQDEHICTAYLASVAL